MTRGIHIPGSTTDLGEGELDTPDLTLVAETILANELELGVTVLFPKRCFGQSMLITTT
jgi:hypothetical protein